MKRTLLTYTAAIQSVTSPDPAYKMEQTWFMLGILALRTKDLDGALTHFEQANLSCARFAPSRVYKALTIIFQTQKKANENLQEFIMQPDAFALFLPIMQPTHFPSINTIPKIKEIWTGPGRKSVWPSWRIRGSLIRICYVP